MLFCKFLLSKINVEQLLEDMSEINKMTVHYLFLKEHKPEVLHVVKDYHFDDHGSILGRDENYESNLKLDEFKLYFANPCDILGSFNKHTYKYLVENYDNFIDDEDAYYQILKFDSNRKENERIEAMNALIKASIKTLYKSFK